VSCGSRKSLIVFERDLGRADFLLLRRGGSIFSQAVLPLLLKQAEQSPEHPPTLIFTGATASMKGGPQTAAFAV
jgi:hypothetical protein